ncbi:hypothetical protein [Actinomadura sp. 7K507]|uniref:hypothetical protein n=1 Tax=Actinomadura sp. 7K507 TaxID=2530365 RepID=UPI001051F50D|nr:hypothetical protein [Actinomadura sp. 7K507]TDC73013.1 hypothetical protein E1285_44910 [Actinomadura sp. 7K507]
MRGAQQLGALALDDPHRQRAAEQALLGCVTDPRHLAELTGPTLCHGWAGLLLTAARAAAGASAGPLTERLLALKIRLAALARQPAAQAGAPERRSRDRTDPHSRGRRTAVAMGRLPPDRRIMSFPLFSGHLLGLWFRTTTDRLGLASDGHTTPADLLARLSPDLADLTDLIGEYPHETQLRTIASRLAGAGRRRPHRPGPRAARP